MGPTRDDDTALFHEPAREPRKAQEGAAMMVVMIMLLMVTAVGAFSIHATSFEVRAAGFSRQAMQSEYMAEAGLRGTYALLENPAFGPRGVMHSVQQTYAASGPGAPTMAPYEIELDASKEGYRIHSQYYTNFGGASPIERDAIGGTRQQYDPRFHCDVNDHYIFSGTNPGERADGGASLNYLVGTYTIRSTMKLIGTDVTTNLGGTDGLDLRAFHEAAGAARGYAVVGPY